MPPALIVVSGWPGAGKSTIADALADESDATVAGFDWLMSGLRAFEDVWKATEGPVERQRAIGVALLSRVAEQQLRRGKTCIVDLVARGDTLETFAALAGRHGVPLRVIECICSDPEVHRSRIEGRKRHIPSWYELAWQQVLRSRETYAPLPAPKLLLDAVNPLEANLALARAYLRSP